MNYPNHDASRTNFLMTTKKNIKNTANSTQSSQSLSVANLSKALFVEHALPIQLASDDTIILPDALVFYPHDYKTLPKTVQTQIKKHDFKKYAYYMTRLGDQVSFIFHQHDDTQSKKYYAHYHKLMQFIKTQAAPEFHIHLGSVDDIRHVVQAYADVFYQLFDRCGLLKKEPLAAHYPNIYVHGDFDVKKAHALLKLQLDVTQGMRLAKDLINLPANIATPSFMANCAKELAEIHNLEIKIIEKDDAEKLGMHCFLSVAQGASSAPKFIVLEYYGDKRKTAKPTILIGKGITFDTGGISLKPAENMDEMKTDMAGAASVFGTLHAACLQKLKKNIVVIMPCCENMPSSTATRPGDVVHTMDGLTVEILNTDAEGRLILCDALTYAQQHYQPAHMINVATLTGACVVALGHIHAALYTRHDDLAEQIHQAGQNSLDTVWRMPLDDDYNEQLKSPFADLANIGGRAGGSITAACFLAHFVAKDVAWAHLDIAGVARRQGKDKGASGRPIPLLFQHLLQDA